jgi:hypothetical protein
MFYFLSKKDQALPEPSEQYIKTRNSFLTSRAGQFNIRSSGKNPDVWGILIDENFGKHIQSVWATADGQLRIFQFAGESKIRDDPRMADLLRYLLFNAEACYSNLTSSTTCPLPVSGNIRFSVFTFAGIYTSEVEVRDLAISKGKHALANLNDFYHNLLFLNNWGKLQFQIDTSFFRPCTVVERTKIYSKPDLNSIPIIELMPENELELGVAKDVAGMKWLTATLPNGQWGYIRGETKLNLTLRLSLFEREVTVYSEPSAQSAVITRMKKNTVYDVSPSGGQDEKWVKIRDSAGNEGFIDGQTRGKKA